MSDQPLMGSGAPLDDAHIPRHANRSAARRALLLPGVATLITFAILVGLGFWQIERMGAKQRLISRVESMVKGPPLALPAEAEWASLRPKSYEYRKVQVQGRFLHDKEFRLHGLLSPPPPARTLQGFYILTPLALDDGTTIIVNRGFVPTERADPASRAQGQLEGRQTVTGLLRAPEVRNWFLPEDDAARNSWFARDPVAMARAAGLTRAAPFVIDADATPVPGGLPIGGTTRLTFSDNHLQYALTWFAIAIGLLVIFWLFARQQLARVGDAPTTSRA